jgi:hypothetical protein
MKTDKISFGTRPYIGWFMADSGLPKYNEKLAGGILNAFETLAKNGVDDEFYIHLGMKDGAKSKYIDVLQLSHKSKGKAESSTALNPDSWVFKLLPEKYISKIILNNYKKLTTSTKQKNVASDIPFQNPDSEISISKTHQEKITKLIKKFGLDDYDLVS